MTQYFRFVKSVAHIFSCFFQKPLTNKSVALIIEAYKPIGRLGNAMTFPNRIRILRKSQKLSQKSFAEKFSVDQTAVSNWEKGKNNIDLTLADKIADAVTVPIEFGYGKPYSITHPQSEWTAEEHQAFQNARCEEEKQLLEFRFGRGVFEGSGATLSREGGISESEIKVALFGGDEEVTDEMWQEVKNFVAYVKQKKDT